MKDYCIGFYMSHPDHIENDGNVVVYKPALVCMVDYSCESIEEIHDIINTDKKFIVFDDTMIHADKFDQVIISEMREEDMCDACREREKNEEYPFDDLEVLRKPTPKSN